MPEAVLRDMTGLRIGGILDIIGAKELPGTVVTGGMLIRDGGIEAPLIKGAKAKTQEAEVALGMTANNATKGEGDT
jgi:hypothetical protein